MTELISNFDVNLNKGRHYVSLVSYFQNPFGDIINGGVQNKTC